MSSRTTRESIVSAAELLFARHGYAATSMRDITEAAGVNIAAVNYHFGSKERLLIEILDQVVGPINTRRVELLDEIEARGEPDAEQVLTAFLRPDLEVLSELRSRDPELPRFVSRMYSEGSELMNQVIGRQFAETQRRFHLAFSTALPNLSAEEIAWRIYCIVGIVVYLFAGVVVPNGPQIGDDVDHDLERLIEVTLPMMIAHRQEVASTQH